MTEHHKSRPSWLCLLAALWGLALLPLPTLALKASPASTLSLPQLELELIALEARTMHGAPGEPYLQQLTQLHERAPRHRAVANRLRYTQARIALFKGQTLMAQQISREFAERGFGGPSLVLQAEIAERQGALDLAGELAQQAWSLMEDGCESRSDDCDPRAAWHSHRLLVLSHLAQAEAATAEQAAERALQLAQTLDIGPYITQSMALLARVAHRLDHPDTVLEWLQQAERAARGDPLSTLQVLQLRAELMRHNPEVALPAITQAAQLAQRSNALHDLQHIRVLWAHLLLRNGAIAQAQQQLKLVREVLPTYQDQDLAQRVSHELTLIHIALRQFDAAQQERQRNRPGSQFRADLVLEQAQLRELGQAYANAGQHAVALELYHAERRLHAHVVQRSRDAALRQLKQQYNLERNQRDLEKLRHEELINEQRLNNQQLLRTLGLGALGVLVVVLGLLGLLLHRTRSTNKALQTRQVLLRENSELDPLTRLANRRLFHTLMQQRHPKQFLGAMLMADIDHFKAINDTHGHAAGDAVICEVARRISASVRHSDVVVRWGGEEFLIYAPDATPEALQQVATRVLSEVARQPVLYGSQALQVSISVGYVHLPIAPSQLAQVWEQAVNWADKALYHAKALGRRRAVGIERVQARDCSDMARLLAQFEQGVSQGAVQVRVIC
ncbi:diguanylate cyclase domain-containing protein [Roseateles sp. BYS180W]|uniref:diguanylate cyclase n=1 Tax=Roseateles rivi TaxID=3299028 RepID=A0ABW7FUF9_9BURK